MSRSEVRMGAIGAKGFYFRAAKRHFDFAFSDKDNFADFVLASTELEARGDNDGYALLSRPYIRFGYWHGQISVREAWVDLRDEERGLSATVNLTAEQYVCDYVRQDEDHISIRLSRAKGQKWPRPEIAQRNMPWMKHALAFSNGMLDGPHEYTDEFLVWWDKQQYLEIFLRDAMTLDRKRLWMLEQTLGAEIARAANVDASTPNESGHDSASPDQSKVPATLSDTQSTLPEPQTEDQYTAEQASPDHSATDGNEGTLADSEREWLITEIKQTFNEGVEGEIRRMEALCSLQHLSLSESRDVYAQTLREIANTDHDAKECREAEEDAAEPT
jgi:hypothetical protein